LIGLQGIAPSRRLELLPYAAGDGEFVSNAPGDHPFRDGSDFDSRLGTDLKMGLGPNLTLDATVNPDFGQVEADPAVVNLSAYEVSFTEKRPFFIEGSQLFAPIGPSYFYSRRIGGSPHGSGLAEGDYTDEPSNTTILGAAKITGRLSSGTSVGVLTVRGAAPSTGVRSGEIGRRGDVHRAPARSGRGLSPVGVDAETRLHRQHRLETALCQG
jgi:hypothetical protein